MGNNRRNNSNNKLSTGQKVWLGLTVVGAGVSLWLLTVVNRTWQENSQNEIRAQELSLKAADVEELEINRQILAEKLTELEGFFLEGETGVAAAAERMEAMANQAEVSLVLAFEDFPDKVDIGGIYQAGLGMHAEVDGSYQRVLEWVRRIEELPYFIRLSEVKIGLVKLGPGVKAEFKGVIFLKNE